MVGYVFNTLYCANLYSTAICCGMAIMIAGLSEMLPG